MDKKKKANIINREIDKKLSGTSQECTLMANEHGKYAQFS